MPQKLQNKKDKAVDKQNIQNSEQLYFKVEQTVFKLNKNKEEKT